MRTLKLCPLHQVGLQQLGYLEEGKWVGERLWNCPECRWPNDPKVFEVVGDVLRKAEV